MRKFAKTDKVGDLVRHAISNALMRELEEPKLSWVTVTEVQMSRDLAVARVFYTVLDSELPKKDAAALLAENTKKLRSYLGRNLHLKMAPELRFVFDEAEERARHIEDLIASLHKDDQKGEDAGDP
jgi:ribosome-binding factor A